MVSAIPPRIAALASSSRAVSASALAGLLLHTFVDGVAIASAFGVSDELGASIAVEQETGLELEPVDRRGFGSLVLAGLAEAVLAR